MATKVFKTKQIDWWNEEIEVVPLTDPEVYHTFSHDPLVLSCTLYRLIKTAKEDELFVRCWSLTEHADKINNKVIDKDLTHAELIRSYYRSKLLVSKLRNENFTKFRTDLLNYLNNNQLRLPSKFVGMIYKLPYFYDYDMQLISIFGGEYKQLDGELVYKNDKELNFISTANNSRKHYPNLEYWFSDENDNRVLVEIAKNNPVLSLWDQVIQMPIIVSAKFEKRSKDNLEYYVASGWNIQV